MRYNQFNRRPFETHRIVYDLVRPYARVLDVGCATGYMGRELRKKHCSVTGIDTDRGALRVARRYCEQVVAADLEKPKLSALENRKFDVILLLDVLEHIRNAVSLLTALRKYILSEGRLIISTPNIAHVSVRWKILSGDFSYTKQGILDETHVHFYTRSTFLAILTVCGYDIEQLYVPSDFGQIPGIGRFLRHVPKGLQYRVTRALPTLLGVQFIAVCRAR